MLAYCIRRIGHPDAEDVAAGVFSVAWRRRDEIEWSTARPWLYGIARGVLSNRWRSNRRRTRLIGRMSGLAETLSVSPDVVVVQKTQDEEVLAALRGLRGNDQEVLMLSAWEELSAPEIAITLEISTSAAEQRLHRAKRRLARALESQERRGRCWNPTPHSIGSAEPTRFPPTRTDSSGGPP